MAMAVESAYSACSARDWSGRRRAFQIRVQSPTTKGRCLQSSKPQLDPSSFTNINSRHHSTMELMFLKTEPGCTPRWQKLPALGHHPTFPQARLVCRRRRSRSTRNGIDNSLCATSTTSHQKSRCTNSSSHARQSRADCMAESLVFRYTREPSYIARTKVTKLIHE
jgi:hypothetical protein